MQIYFSHSYRDVAVNSYFLEQFTRVNHEGQREGVGESLSLCADKKSEVWCVAKLERYLFELSGFVSVIPRRITQDRKTAYSEYIGYELALARRARAPRLLFVDDQVLREHKGQFPKDAVPFLSDTPQSERIKHQEAIRNFKRTLELGGARPSQSYRPRQATLVAPDEETVLRAAAEMADFLSTESYNVKVVKGREYSGAFQDIRLLERLAESEFVFLLGELLSYAHVVLAMAHAQCIPSIRFQYDSQAESNEPELTGIMRWKSSNELLAALKIQLNSFRRGFVMPLELSEDANEAARSVATPETARNKKNEWDFDSGADLLRHVQPGAQYVRDRVESVSRTVGGLGNRSDRAFSSTVCEQLYEEIHRRDYYYDLEYKSIKPGVQEIFAARRNTPATIWELPGSGLPIRIRAGGGTPASTHRHPYRP